MASPVPSSSSAPPREQHLLTLKVLRATKPSLVHSLPHQHPYHDGAGAHAFQALQPRSHTSHPPEQGQGGGQSGIGMLRVPAEFGQIYLGETFSAILSLSNDTLSPALDPDPALLAHSPTLKVEMHTALSLQTGQPTNKHLLATISSAQLAPGDSQESQVAHELKELGQNALVCTVQYGQEVQAENGEKRLISRSFRKVYKFPCASPLSVRTKAHSSGSSCPTSALSAVQRSLVFLEVQVVNHHHSSLFFERMRFEPLSPPPLPCPNPAPAEKPPPLTLADDFLDPNEGLFSNDQDALLPPGGVRQFLYVLRQSEEERQRAVPGANQGLGRLDIIWRTPHGEMGRLQSSTLGRRIPPATSSAPAVPPFVGGASPALPPLPPRSPPQPAPYRTSFSIDEPAVASSTPTMEPRLPSAEGLDFDFTVDDLPMDRAVRVDEPFEVAFRVAVSVLPSLQHSQPRQATTRKRRRVRLAAQHILPAPLETTTAAVLPPANQQGHPLTLPAGAFHPPSSAVILPPTDATSQRRPPAFPAAHTAAQPSLNGILLPAPFFPSPLASPSISHLHLNPPPSRLDGPAPLPPPSAHPPGEFASLPIADSSIVRLGSGIVDLGWVTLVNPAAGADLDAPQVEDRVEASEAVKGRMRFLALPGSAGLGKVGGVRLLLLDVEDEGGEPEVREQKEGQQEQEGLGGLREATVVGEWGVVAEVWVEE
ncbi:hypothetical protein JCM11641_001857 [Rhodosporidiobolus odoratus]